MRGKLKRQITLIVITFILLSSIPIGVFSLLQMNRDKNILTNSVNNTIEGTLDSMSEGFSGAIRAWLDNIALVPARTMEEKARYALEKIDVFYQMNNEAAQKQVQKYSEDLNQLVENYRKVLESSVSRIAIVKTTGGFSFVYPPRSDYVSDIRTEPWYEQAINTGTITFSPPFLNPETGYLEIAMGYPIKLTEDNILGVIGIYMRLDQISTISRLSAVMDKNQDTYSSFFFLVYIPENENVSAPIILAYPDTKYVGLPMNMDFLRAYGEKARTMKSEYEKTLKLTENDKKDLLETYNKIKNATDGSILDVRMFNTDLRVKIQTIPGTPWKIVSAINRTTWLKPVEEISQSINRTRNFFMIFLVLLIVIAGFLSYLTLSKIFDPLIEIERKILRMGQGDLREDLDYPYDNDIKLIVNAINEMKSNLKDTIEILRHQKRSE